MNSFSQVRVGYARCWFYEFQCLHSWFFNLSPGACARCQVVASALLAFLAKCFLTQKRGQFTEQGRRFWQGWLLTKVSTIFQRPSCEAGDFQSKPRKLTN